MNPVKCEICDREEKSLFLINHKTFGRIRICSVCLKKEEKNLLALKSCDCGCC